MYICFHLLAPSGPGRNVWKKEPRMIAVQVCMGNTRTTNNQYYSSLWCRLSGQVAAANDEESL
jgi:hypothetical protein